MTLKESIVENAALTWFGKQSRCSRTLTPTLCLRPSPLRSGSHGERKKCKAIRRLNLAILEEA